MDQTRADIAFLRQRARGARPNPLVERPPQKRRHRAPEGRPVRVTRIVPETNEAVSLHLEALDGKPLDHIAGQFLSFDVRVDGVKLRRAYSLANAPGDAPFVTVKRVEGGRVSNALNELGEGTRLSVLGPSGSFTFEPSARSHTYVLIAGGSGITPIFSILQAVLRDEPTSRVALVYANRTADAIIFRKQLESLACDRLVVRHVLDDVDGRLDQANTAHVLDELGTPVDAPHYLCGPTPMMDAVRKTLRVRGVETLYEEKFVSPEARAEVASTLPQTCEIVVDGRSRTVPVKANQTLLDAGLAMGVSMPFSCAMGGCAACKVQLLDGEIVADEPNCLTDAEKAQGWVLACCSRPRTPCRIEVPQ